MIIMSMRRTEGRIWSNSPRRPGQPRRFQLPTVPDEFAAARWVHEYDAAWFGQDWARLARYLAADVRFIPQGSTLIHVGREAMISHLRAFLEHTEIHEYNATGFRVRVFDGIGFVSFRWHLDQSSGGLRRASEGRDLLTLRRSDGLWQMAWRRPLRS